MQHDNVSPIQKFKVMEALTVRMHDRHEVFLNDWPLRPKNEPVNPSGPGALSSGICLIVARRTPFVKEALGGIGSKSAYPWYSSLNQPS